MMLSELLTDKLHAEILAHAKQQAPRECCGMLVLRGRAKVYVPMSNIAEKNEHFVLDPSEQVMVEDSGHVLAIVHSHPFTPATPSAADKVGIERSGLPWVIVNPTTETFSITTPSGYQAPLVGREFSHGVLDCYSLVKDAFAREKGIYFKDYHRPDEWWLRGMNLYREHMLAEGFIEIKSPDVPLPDLLKPWDLILMQVASPVENHAAIYLGDNMILHHVMNRLSCHDVYGGWWRQITRSVWRHSQLMEPAR